MKLKWLTLIAVGLSSLASGAAPLEMTSQLKGDLVLCADGKSGKISGEVVAVEGVGGEKALRLNGPDAAIEIPYGGNPEQVAVEGWIRLPENPRFVCIAKRRGKNNQWQLYAAPAGKDDYFIYATTWKQSDGKENFQGKSSIKLKAGKFHHVAMELDGNRSAKLFVDGKEVCSAVPAEGIRSGSSPLTVGGGKTGEKTELTIQNLTVYDSLLPDGWRKKIEERQAPWRKTFSPDQVLNFSAPGAWLTAPVEILALMPEEKMWSGATRFANDPGKRIEAKSMAALALGAQAGPDGLCWNRHPEFPTLFAGQVPADWSKQPAVTLKLTSKAATGETVYLAFRADSAKTPHRDYYYFPLSINFTGEKSITIARDRFQAFGEPAGWDKVDGIAFFCKMFGAEPHPGTELVLRSLRPDGAEAENSAAFAADIPQAKDADGFILKTAKSEYQRQYLNHSGPETRNDAEIAAPYAHQNYQNTERATFDYLPTFLPGYISYDPAGRAVIHSGDLVQYKNADGKWEYADLKPYFKAWAREQGWAGLQLNWGLHSGEKAIRFDRDGDAYVLAPVERLDADGKTVDWHSRCVLLFHSRDRFKTFAVYRLPQRVAAFEKIDGHNQSALERPPVILLGDYSYFADADPAGYFVIPGKASDGKLTFDKVVKYADFVIPPDQHSGGANSVITCGNQLFIVFSVASVQAMAMKDVKNAKKTVMPPIPPDHPGLQLSCHRQGKPEVAESSKNGTPAFIVDYNLDTGVLGEPLYLLSGGVSDDGHNNAGITVDSKGTLHVIANGHHNPTAYTYSLKPYDIRGAWSKPEYIIPGKAQPNLSYATLNCDREDNLYSVHRSTKDVYNNHLGLYVKPAGQPWRDEIVLVTPYKYMYKVWGQKMSYNPAADTLTLGFYSHSSQKQLSPDQYLFEVFQYPDQEKHFTEKAKGDFNSGLNAKMYAGTPSELTNLTLNKATRQWQLTTGKNLK